MQIILEHSFCNEISISINVNKSKYVCYDIIYIQLYKM